MVSHGSPEIGKLKRDMIGETPSRHLSEVTNQILVQDLDVPAEDLIFLNLNPSLNTVNPVFLIFPFRSQVLLSPQHYARLPG